MLSDRLSAEIRDALDPIFDSCGVRAAVAAVKWAPDLRSCTVLWMPAPEAVSTLVGGGRHESEDDVGKALRRSRGRIYERLTSTLNLRRMPRVRFAPISDAAVEDEDGFTPHRREIPESP